MMVTDLYVNILRMSGLASLEMELQGEWIVTIVMCSSSLVLRNTVSQFNDCADVVYDPDLSTLVKYLWMKVMMMVMDLWSVNSQMGLSWSNAQTTPTGYADCVDSSRLIYPGAVEDVTVYSTTVCE